MIRVGMIGLGKMGLSHLAMLRAHPSIQLTACCDASTFLNDVLSKYAGLKCYEDFDQLLELEALDAVVVATPSNLHAHMVEQALRRNLHVFCEKPFVLSVQDGERLISLAEDRKLVNQVGYHYRFVGAFREAARLVRAGALGKIHHVRVEAYGPVVLRAKGATWRSIKAEGGGSLYDYACHAIDLTNFIVGMPSSVGGVVRQGVFSENVDDEVYCTFRYADGASGQLCVNWSDESLRKMSVRIFIWGTQGRINADRQACQIYLRRPHEGLAGVGRGWTIRYITELTDDVWFYLRGEEYSAQIDYFAQSILAHRLDGENTFRSALDTDRVVSMILGEPVAKIESAEAPRRGILARMFG